MRSPCFSGGLVVSVNDLPYKAQSSNCQEMLGVRNSGVNTGPEVIEVPAVG